MRRHTIKLLQYKDVCNIIKGYCILEEGGAFCESILPTKDIKEIIRRKKYGLDALNLLEKSLLPSLRVLPPIKPFIAKLDSGDVLEIEGIYAIFLLVSLVQDLHKWQKKTKNIEKNENVIFNIVDAMPGLEDLYRSLSSFIDESGKIKEVPTLKAISKKIMDKEARIKKSISHYFSDESIAFMLQSKLPQNKNDHHLLALKANFKGRIKGIIHEYSQSEKTLYIEPEDVVLQNNELQILKEEWQKEYIRILRCLTNDIFEQKLELEESLSILIEMDYIFAIAKWAKVHNAKFLMEEGKGIDIKNARHPLMKNFVPLSINMQGDKKILVITGANAGGKSVALKTLAILSLMNQAGMPLLLDEKSSLPYFDFIACDIGDEQSIESDVSTFSASIKNIASILDEATKNSLLLFDEMGGGTDVEEGSALSMAILDELIARGSYALITTHHSMLKKYAFSHKECINAAVEFSAESNKPTYRLVLGIQGESHALDVASNYGLSQNIIKRAKEYMSSSSNTISNIINDLMQKQKELLDLEDALKKDRKEILESKRKYDLSLLALKQKEMEIKKGSLKNATKLFDEKKKEIENLVRRLIEGHLPEKEDRKHLKTWIAQVDAMLQEEKNIIELDEKNIAELSSSDDVNNNIDNKTQSFKVGDVVYSKNYKQECVILRLEKKGFALVSFGSIKTNVSIKDLSFYNNPPPSSILPPLYEISKDDRLPYELKILGLRAEEAKKALDEHFDKVLFYNLKEFSIVHGKGEGILQKIVHESLSASSVVKEFYFARPEFGGAGKTIVKLK